MVNNTPQTPTRAAVGLAVHMGQPEPLPSAGFEVVHSPMKLRSYVQRAVRDYVSVGV